ncbi:hypothetical protein [Streptomyces sp. NPDC017988]|uniref:hypothetical protein n=1 Tax=Streptomyces sp. NPDC017988 TaxID=3365025 RepID=UPI00378F5693
MLCDEAQRGGRHDDDDVGERGALGLQLPGLVMLLPPYLQQRLDFTLVSHRHPRAPAGRHVPG